MAFKKDRQEKEKVELVSLIDMIFILLVFFLVTSIVTKGPLMEQGVYIPTPKLDRGRAQIFLQIMKENEYLWIDESATADIDRYQRIYSGWGKSDREVTTDMLQQLMVSSAYRLNTSGLSEKIGILLNRAKRSPSDQFFIVIRSPNDMPFTKVMNLIALFGDTPNIRYGLVGGELNDLKNIYTKQDGSRDNIYIDFN